MMRNLESLSCEKLTVFVFDEFDNTKTAPTKFADYFVCHRLLRSEFEVRRAREAHLPSMIGRQRWRQVPFGARSRAKDLVPEFGRVFFARYDGSQGGLVKPSSKSKQ
jgi:hypothetical protein